MTKRRRSHIIYDVLSDAEINKTFVGLVIRFKKNGKYFKVNGKIGSIEENNNGRGYLTIKNRSDKINWQSISLDNILSVNTNGMKYSA